MGGLEVGYLDCGDIEQWGVLCVCNGDSNRNYEQDVVRPKAANIEEKKQITCIEAQTARKRSSGDNYVSHWTMIGHQSEVS